MATNVKLFTLTILQSEERAVKQILKKFRKDIIDSDKSKVFRVDGFKLMSYHVVCTEEIFTEIVQAANGQRIY